MKKTGIVFWSGGKDAWLAFRQVEGEYKELKLLVTYNLERGMVPHQEISLAHIRLQARHLGLPLLEGPLPTEPDNEMYLRTIRELLDHYRAEEVDLIFGDLHLEDIRTWRENAFGEYHCRFPIWKKPYEELWSRLFSESLRIEITGVDPRYADIIRAGEPYDRRFIARLPEGIDPMGEYGEFHTRIDPLH